MALVTVVVAVAALTATACTPGPPPTAAAGHGPPPVTVLMQGAGNGDIFIAPQAGGYANGYANGLEILTSSAKVVWFHALPAGEMADDFRARPTRAGRCSRGSRARA